MSTKKKAETTPKGMNHSTDTANRYIPGKALFDPNTDTATRVALGAGDIMGGVGGFGIGTIAADAAKRRQVQFGNNWARVNEKADTLVGNLGKHNKRLFPSTAPNIQPTPVPSSDLLSGPQQHRWTGHTPQETELSRILFNQEAPTVNNMGIRRVPYSTDVEEVISALREQRTPRANRALGRIESGMATAQDISGVGGLSGDTARRLDLTSGVGSMQDLNAVKGIPGAGAPVTRANKLLKSNTKNLRRAFGTARKRPPTSIPKILQQMLFAGAGVGAADALGSAFYKGTGDNAVDAVTRAIGNGNPNNVRFPGVDYSKPTTTTTPAAPPQVTPGVAPTNAPTAAATNAATNAPTAAAPGHNTLDDLRGQDLINFLMLPQ